MSVTGEKEEGVDPFQYLTIVSVCMAVYRQKFLWETWQVTLQDQTEPCLAMLKDGQLTVLVDNHWIPVQNLQITSTKFVSSPLAQVPAAGYVKQDN